MGLKPILAVSPSPPPPISSTLSFSVCEYVHVCVLTPSDTRKGCSGVELQIFVSHPTGVLGDELWSSLSGRHFLIRTVSLAPQMVIFA